MTNVTNIKTGKPAPSRDTIDAAMLESMSASLRMMGRGVEVGFSFNSFDMADLMDRCRKRITREASQ